MDIRQFFSPSHYRSRFFCDALRRSVKRYKTRYRDSSADNAVFTRRDSRMVLYKCARAFEAQKHPSPDSRCGSEYDIINFKILAAGIRQTRIYQDIAGTCLRLLGRQTKIDTGLDGEFKTACCFCVVVAERSTDEPGSMRVQTAQLFPLLSNLAV